jgi:hypothetical protein
MPASRDPPQLVVLDESKPPPTPKVELVQYTGVQSHLGGIQSRRRPPSNARGVREEVGNLLHWAATGPTQSDHRAPGAVKTQFRLQS